MADSDEFQDFEREILATVPALLGMARRLTRNQHEAEDLVQESLLKAVRSRRHYEPGTHIKAWLFKILRNTFINRYHRGQLERSILSAPAPDPVADGWVGAASMRQLRDTEAGALRPELQKQLTHALDQIPQEFRIVVLLADVEELSYKEIADTLECPIGTVMSRLHRGRRLLRSHLMDVAREAGLLGPEDFIGPAKDAPEKSAPVDLDAYRDRALGGKAR